MITIVHFLHQRPEMEMDLEEVLLYIVIPPGQA
jgi:hypothetical protein